MRPSHRPANRHSRPRDRAVRRNVSIRAKPTENAEVFDTPYSWPVIDSPKSGISSHDVHLAAGDLLDAIRQREPPLRSIANTLADLAARIGVDRAVISIDDPAFGRQVFSSLRSPLDDCITPLFGRACLVTEPPTSIDPDAERVLLLATSFAFATLTEGTSRAHQSNTAKLRLQLEPEVSRAVALGWRFALVLARCELPHRVETATPPNTAPGEELFVLDEAELALIIPAIQPDRVPVRLAQFAQDCSLPTMTFGLAICPADASTVDDLLEVAAVRLAQSLESRQKIQQPH